MFKPMEFYLKDALIGLHIRYAVDTHQHNDYLSGIIELKQRGSVDLLAAARV
jgi:hydroxyacylglutathione hydrolase